MVGDFVERTGGPGGGEGNSVSPGAAWGRREFVLRVPLPDSRIMTQGGEGSATEEVLIPA